MTNTRLKVSNDNVSSVGTESNINNQEGAGLLSFLFGSSENARLVTKAFSRNNIAAAEFLIENGFDIDVNYCDHAKRNAIHYMTKYSTQSKIISNKLVELLSDGVDESVIRLQDEDGNTPLHFAVFAGNDYVAELLEKNGALLSTRNKYGDYIAPEGNTQVSAHSVFIKAKQVQESHADKFNTQLDKIIKLFATRKTDDDTASIGFTRADTHETDNAKHATPVRTEDSVESQTEDSVEPQTDDFVKSLLQNLQGGGAKSRSQISSRKISTYSHSEVVSEGGHYSPVSNSNFSEYAKALNNQKNDLHLEAVKKIMEVLGTDDEYLARSYKALLYQKIKEDDPDNTMNGLDRATKMLSLVNKTELKKIKKDKVDPIYDYLVKKDKERQERKKDDTTSSNKDNTSSTNKSNKITKSNTSAKTHSSSSVSESSSFADLTTEYVLSTEV